MRVSGSKSRAALAVVLTSLMFAPQASFAAEKPQYLPPIAPALDRSVFNSSDANNTSRSSAAPSRSQSFSGGSTGSDVTADNDSADRVKDLLRQALAKHQQGDLNGAGRLFQQVLSIDPRNSDANFNLGAMAEDGGDLNGALRYYQAAAKANPGDSDVRDAVASVQDKMRQQQAAQQTAQQLQQKQQLKGIAQDAAAAYKAGKYDQAINGLQQIVRQTPNDGNALFALGQAYRGKGDKAQARQYLQRALAAEPGNQLYRTTLSDLDHEAQQPQVAQGQRSAPDYSGRGARGGNGYQGGGYGNSGGGGSGSGWAEDNQGLQPYNNDGQDIASNQPEGQITPFTDQGSGQLYGHAYGNSAMGGGLGGIGMGMGMGGLGSMLGMGMMNGGVSRMGGGAYYGGRGTRLVRNAAMGGLAGAAVGGLMNMHGAGGFRSGAIRGAVSGGLMGLITGF